jgi:membrane protease YdiL (CAAX protease family)
VASIPFGIILCFITIKSNSIWPAIILHTVLALSNEWFSLYFHPKISIRKFR